MDDDRMPCIRCEDGDALVPNGYCGACMWAVRGEIEEGLVEMRLYLRRWAEYSDWCSERGLAA